MSTLICSRCTTANPGAGRFCGGCGLPLGSAEADSEAWIDLFDAAESAEPSDVDATRPIRGFVARAGAEATPIGANWRIDVLLPMGRKQAVYLGRAGSDVDGRLLVALMSICGTTNDRDGHALLRLNARTVAGHFAIRVLRGEEYFVVIRHVAVDQLDAIDAARVVLALAAAADDLEDRLTRGRDLF